jgi:hypothetical protein
LEKRGITENIIEIWKKTGKVSIIKSSGRCMIPLFDDGTPLVVRYVPPEEIRIGDIAVFRFNNGIVSHRIIRKFRKGGRLYFWEKNDSGFAARLIPGEAIIGKVIGLKKENEIIKLEKGIWNWTNRFVGYYWFFFYSLYQVMRGLKKRILKEKKIPLTNKAYTFVSSLLIYTANFFISLIRRLNDLRNKP